MGIDRSGVEGVAAAELDVGRIDVFADATGVVPDHRTSFVHLFGENTILGMQELGVTTGVDPVDLVVLNPGLEFGAQLGAEGEALLLAGEIHQVFA